MVAGRRLAARMLRVLDPARTKHSLQSGCQGLNSQQQSAAGVMPGPTNVGKYGVLQIADALAEQRDRIVEPLQLFRLQAMFLASRA